MFLLVRYLGSDILKTLSVPLRAAQDIISKMIRNWFVSRAALGFGLATLRLKAENAFTSVRLSCTTTGRESV